MDDVSCILAIDGEVARPRLHFALKMNDIKQASFMSHHNAASKTTTTQ